MIYISGSYANPKQRDLIRHIEGILEACGVPSFSPMRDNMVLPDASEKEKRAGFDCNIDAVDDCDVLLAVLDYVVPEQHELVVLRPPRLTERSDVVRHGALIAQPVHIPDTRTVFDMGMAFACTTPIVGFYLTRNLEAINSMLANACRGVLFGTDALRRFVKSGKCDWTEAGVWTG